MVGKEGLIEGDVSTQDAVISGRVLGTLTAESRLELQATSRIEGEVRARRMQLEEGAMLNGTVLMGAKEERQDDAASPASFPPRADKPRHGQLSSRAEPVRREMWKTRQSIVARAA